FVAITDDLYGPITTVRKDGRIEKHIRWSAFKFSAQDWNHVADCKAILEDTNRIQQLFLASKNVLIYKAIPALETLLTQWENKLVDPHFELYHPALEAGLAKFRKYYEKFDEKPAYILSLFIHPYYKLNWIELHWGGADAQAEAIAGGDGYAQNWMDEAEKLVEATVCACLFFSGLFSSQSAG
ncbi:hypothetical protein BDP27DRAFT_1251621, partial [Rhodocollybia butyracea]